MSKTKVAVLIDLANISNAFDAIKKARNIPYKSKMDYTKLVSTITLGSDVVSKSVYVGTKSTSRESEKALRNFFGYLTNNGFRVVTKEYKVINIGDGMTKTKSNFDVEITFDACAHIWKRECSEVILVSGDSDFAYLVDKAKELDFKITIVSSRDTISTELRERADRLILLDDLDLGYLSFDSEKKNGA
jgi:uncharacterized LabA/DUF88 family protein